MFLIQGVFFQNQEWLGTRMMPIDGMVAVIERGLVFDMYAGVIRQNPDFPPQLLGGMFDHYGESVLSDIEVNGIQVRFKKQYIHRRDEISYVFKVKDGDTWVGEYSGEEVGNGLSRCLITEVDDSFNDPENLMKLMETRVVHTWNKK